MLWRQHPAMCIAYNIRPECPSGPAHPAPPWPRLCPLPPPPPPPPPPPSAAAGRFTACPLLSLLPCPLPLLPLLCCACVCASVAFLVLASDVASSRALYIAIITSIIMIKVSISNNDGGSSRLARAAISDTPIAIGAINVYCARCAHGARCVRFASIATDATDDAARPTRPGPPPRLHQWLWAGSPHEGRVYCV